MEKFSKSTIGGKASKLGISYEYLDQEVYFNGERVNFWDLLKKYWLSKSVDVTARKNGLSRQDVADRIAKMFIIKNGVCIRTVHSFVSPIEDYIQCDGKLWGVSEYIKHYSPTWDWRTFFATKTTHQLTTQETFDLLEANVLRRAYTEAEDNILLENSNKTAEEIQQLLPNRSINSIIARASRLRLKVSSRPSDKNYTQIRRNNRYIERASLAYIGTDRKQYCFLVCRTCRRVLIVSTEHLYDFRHLDNYCCLHEVPHGMGLPKYITSVE